MRQTFGQFWLTFGLGHGAACHVFSLRQCSQCEGYVKECKGYACTQVKKSEAPVQAVLILVGTRQRCLSFMSCLSLFGVDVGAV